MAYYETGSEVDISYDVFGNITQIRYDIGFYLKGRDSGPPLLRL